MNASGFCIRLAQPSDLSELQRLRLQLWPDLDAAESLREINALVSDKSRFAIFVCELAYGRLGGFLEASIREYADDCESAPVGYLEGWFVEPSLRRGGIGRRLVSAAESWARSLGMKEMASDTEIGNTASRAAHDRIGYRESSVLVHFQKSLE